MSFFWVLTLSIVGYILIGLAQFSLGAYMAGRIVPDESREYSQNLTKDQASAKAAWNWLAGLFWCWPACLGLAAIAAVVAGPVWGMIKLYEASYDFAHKPAQEAIRAKAFEEGVAIAATASSYDVLRYPKSAIYEQICQFLGVRKSYFFDLKSSGETKPTLKKEPVVILDS